MLAKLLGTLRHVRSWIGLGLLERTTERTLLLRALFTVTVGVVLLFACIQPDPTVNGDVNELHGASGSHSAGESAGSHPSAQLGIVFDEAMRVIDVDHDSIAEKAGVQKGDVLIAIEDIPFATEKQKAKELIWTAGNDVDFDEYIKTGAWNGKILRLRVERNGASIEMEVMPMPPYWWGIEPQPTPGFAPLEFI